MQCFENVGNKNGLKPDIWASIQFSGDNVWSMPLIKHHPWAKLFNYRSLCRQLISRLYLKNKEKKTQKLLFTLHSQQQPLLSTWPFSFLSILTFFSPCTVQFFFTFSSRILTGYPSECWDSNFCRRQEVLSLCWFFYRRWISIQSRCQDWKKTCLFKGANPAVSMSFVFWCWQDGGDLSNTF